MVGTGRSELGDEAAGGVESPTRVTQNGEVSQLIRAFILHLRLGAHLYQRGCSRGVVKSVCD